MMRLVVRSPQDILHLRFLDSFCTERKNATGWTGDFPLRLLQIEFGGMGFMQQTNNGLKRISIVAFNDHCLRIIVQNHGRSDWIQR
jgi:hypothetical protein